MTNSLREIALCSDSNPQLRDAVILFHGMTGTPSEMQELAAALHSSGFDCFAPRLSGHDLSIEELANVSLDLWLKDAERMIETTKEYRSVYVVGQSFGALLALHLLLKYPDSIKAGVLLSLPWKFRSGFQEIILTLLSYLPDSMLNKLGYRKKKHRDGVHFRRKRHAYSSHSIGAAARVFQLRARLARDIYKLKRPLLLLHDPLDHHLSLESVLAFRKSCPGDIAIDSKWMHGGYHELSLGPCFTTVLNLTREFFKGSNLDAS